MTRLKAFLILIGGLLGPLNLGLFYSIGTYLHPIPFYEKMTNLQIFALFGGVWYVLLFVPSVISTALTLLVLWRQLLLAKGKRQHIFWGMLFGGIATIFSTGLFILFGILFNYSHGISSGTESILELGLIIPGGLVLGAVFIILFSPAILIAGPVYGLIAMLLKQKNLSEH